MPLDTLCLTALNNELSSVITGMKIDKVNQLERDVLLLALRGKAGTEKLFISAGSGDMRVHLTTGKYENPTTPPMFCMLLRKHLVGARIAQIVQPAGERVLKLVLDGTDAMGEASRKMLIIELISISANVILVDEDGIIIDCLKRVGGDITTGKRSVLPGLRYREPNPQVGKLNPLELTEDLWKQLWSERETNSDKVKSVDKWIISVFLGFSPLIARELSWRAYGSVDYDMNMILDGGQSLSHEIFRLIDSVKSGETKPWSIRDEAGLPRDFSYTQILQYESALEVSQEQSFSVLLDKHFTKTFQIARVRARASATLKTVKTARDRIIRKLATLHSDLDKTTKRDYLRECGDLITGNLYKMEKGQSILLAEDYFSDVGAVREIKLDPLKTPQQNAAKYYKDYTKAKTAQRILTEQISLGETEALYLASVIESINLAQGEKDIDEIRRELISTGYIREKRVKGAKVKSPPPTAPMKFISSSGMQILAGRNNVQNEQLVHKIAQRSDLWFHAQKYHGSHVIISCGGAEPDEQTIHEAAVIAAYYSAGRDGGKVPVDYVPVRSVKKQPGGRPGMVIYNGFQTIVAQANEALVESLQA